VSPPGLEGTGRVADDLWLLAHSDVTGRSYIQPRPLGLGLPGALLAELALVGVVSVAGDQITVTTGHRPPGDALASQVLSLMAKERESHPVGEWLAYLARTAPDGVASRLAAAGYLVPAGRWPPWRPARWMPADRDSAFAPVLRARAALDASRSLTIHTAVLAGLADACGLGFHLAQYAPAHHARPADQVANQLGPGLQDLIAQVKTAVDSAVLAHRV
jgi:Golgi phosphoprotein 3 (GPP34)